MSTDRLIVITPIGAWCKLDESALIELASEDLDRLDSFSYVDQDPTRAILETGTVRRIMGLTTEDLGPVERIEEVTADDSAR